MLPRDSPAHFFGIMILSAGAAAAAPGAQIGLACFLTLGLESWQDEVSSQSFFNSDTGKRGEKERDQIVEGVHTQPRA